MEYEQEKTNKDIEIDGDDAKKIENEYFSKKTDEQKKNKAHLKKFQEESENANIHLIAKEEKND